MAKCNIHVLVLVPPAYVLPPVLYPRHQMPLFVFDSTVLAMNRLGMPSGLGPVVWPSPEAYLASIQLRPQAPSRTRHYVGMLVPRPRFLMQPRWQDRAAGDRGAARGCLRRRLFAKDVEEDLEKRKRSVSELRHRGQSRCCGRWSRSRCSANRRRARPVLLGAVETDGLKMRRVSDREALETAARLPKVLTRIDARDSLPHRATKACNEYFCKD